MFSGFSWERKETEYRLEGQGTMTKLTYGNTNTFFIPGSKGGLLVDTDYAGTLQALYRVLKKNDIRIKDIAYVLATHYHPDHMGLIGVLMEQGVKLLLIDVQREHVHFSDRIFERDRLSYRPVEETQAAVISCEESREFLARLGISGEIIHTPSHSEDSICLILDDGNCFAGDLEPFEYMEAYEENAPLRDDWDRILAFRPRRVFYAHMPDRAV